MEVHEAIATEAESTSISAMFKVSLVIVSLSYTVIRFAIRPGLQASSPDQRLFNQRQIFLWKNSELSVDSVITTT
jgi:hypothetical protein